jgi:hypothetical protein
LKNVRRGALLFFMATNSIGSGRELISTTIDSEIVQEILRRAEAMEQNGTKTTKGAFARLVYEWWWSQGAPAVSPLDVGGKRKEWTTAAPFLNDAFKDDKVFAPFEAVMTETLERMRSARGRPSDLPKIQTD